MPNTVISLKKSATPSAAPVSLANGELAINYADGKLFYKHANGTIAAISSGAAGDSFGTVNAAGTLIIADTAGDILTLEAGSGITITGDAINDKITISSTGGDISPALIQANTARDQANAAFDKANSANVLAFNTGLGANAFTSATIAGANTAVGTGANAFTSATIAGANTAVGTGANAFTSATIAGANTAVGAGANAYANLVWSRSNTRSDAIGVSANAFTSATIAGANTAVGTGANAFTSATIAGANTAVGTGANAFTSATIAGANTAVGTAANNFASATIAGANTAVGTAANNFSSATIAGANTAVGAGANAYANLVWSRSNTYADTVGTSANAYMIAVQNGSNTAVGTGANAFTSATIAGANTAVGTGANAFTSATIAGANTAVGTGANNFASATIAGANTAVGTAANNFASATIAGANTAVGTAANNFTSATIAGANTAVGTGANAFTSATIAGANTAVGLGANTYANATFVKLTAASQTITGNVNIVGNLTLSGNTFIIDATRLEVDDPLIYLAANNYTSDLVDIGFIGNYVNSTGANVHTGLYREHTDKMYYLFQGYDKEPENNHIGALSNNMTLAVLNADLRTSNLVLGGANAILTIASVGTGANAFTSATIAGANTAVGTGANAFASATIAGANTAVGTGANAFTSATIAGANTAVGAGANAYANLVWSRSNTFTSSTIAGANTAVGTGANAFTSATIAGANTAVGTAANNFTSATIAGANTAVGTAANNFASSTIAGANTAVGTAANNFSIATFGAANNTPVGNTLASLFTSRSTRRSLNFIPGTNITINVDDDSAGNRANITVSSTAGGGDVTTATLNGANTAVGAGANAYANLVWSRSNTFTSSTIAGANTAVGAGANAFTSATIAGANTAVGAGANTVAVAAFAKANATTYTSNIVISVADNTNAALRITQTGTGEAIRVEDSANPDSTPFVVDASGQVGFGTATPFPLTSTFISTRDPLVASDGSYIGGGAYWDGATWRSTVASQGGWVIRNTTGMFTLWTGYNSGAANTVPPVFSERLRVDGNGSVLIGTTSARSNFLNASLASAGFQVEGTTAANASMSIVRDGANANPPRMYLAKSRGTTIGSNALVQSGDILGSISFEGNDGAEFVEGAKIDSVVDATAASDSMPSRLEFHTSSAGALFERMRIDASGNVGIGTTSPSSLLSVSGGQIRIQTSGTYSEPAVIAGILSFDSVSGQLTISSRSNGGSTHTAFFTSDSGTGAERMRITSAGNVGIGTTNPAYKLEVAGSFAAQTKSFVINHPTKEGQFLRYGSLEGPENGVYVRGKLEGKSIIELPDYWWNLVDESTITVNLTPIDRSQDIWVQSTSAYFIHLNQPADCFFTVFAERKDVDKLVVEY